MKIKMKENVLKEYSISKYVDDCTINMESIGLGTRWVEISGNMGERLLGWQQSWETEDICWELDHNWVTLDGMSGLANSITPSLTFPGDLLELHSDGRLPMLDFCT